MLNVVPGRPQNAISYNNNNNNNSTNIIIVTCLRHLICIGPMLRR